MARAIWKGAISFGLVTIPIKVYPAIKKEKISFTSLCPHCKQPIKHKRWCPHCNKEVNYAELLKGYKIAKDKYIILTKEELERIKLKTTKCIEIYEFVDLNQIDPIYFETAYYIVPDELGAKAYSLFAEALRLSNKAAIGKVVMRNKEYLVLLRAYKKGIVMHILHYLGEVRNIEEVKEVLDSKENLKRILLDNFSPEEMTSALELINNQFETEASGGINLYSIRKYAETGVNYISIGALTHSPKSLDLSLLAIN